MALSAAEKQRRYRAKRDADAQRRSEYLQKEKDKYKRDKDIGKKKLVKDMTCREHRSAKKKWRTYKQSVKKMQKDLAKQLTPPQTPDTIAEVNVSRQKKEGTKVRDRNRAKIRRKISCLQQLLEKEKRRADMFRKRFERLRKKENVNNAEDTPRTKTRKLLKHFNSSKKTVRKTLTFHYCLMDQLRHHHKTFKRTLPCIVAGHILKKYRFKQFARKKLGIHTGIRPKRRKGCLSIREANKVKIFFERDDVSRTTAGKRNTITRKKAKKQKRLLNDSLQNLYQKFKSENNSSLSLTTFYRLKPFYIVKPSPTDRETCLCKTCENLRFKAESLQKIKAVPDGSIENLVKHVACNAKSQTCMYNNCGICKEKSFEVSNDIINDTVTWHAWRAAEKEIVKDGKDKQISVVVKELQSGTVGDLLEVFSSDLLRYKRHFFNIYNQFQYYRGLKSNLKEDECLIHVDFSENYTCKMSSEIQSMHFGASKPQISLQTGIYYVGQNISSTFATVSDDLDHSPPGIWAHLSPVLKEIKTKFPSVDTVHFFSDGPVTQYRQKGNFFLWSTEIHDDFKTSSWNFHEAGHGKGIPDGIGGTLKRLADNKVRLGSDIMSASDFIGAINNSTRIHLHKITTDDFQKYRDKLKGQTLRSISGTMKIHQMFTPNTFNILHREVSCNCSTDNYCISHKPTAFTFANFVKTEPENVFVSSKDTSDDPVTSSRGSNTQFKKYLADMQSCKSFKSLKGKCKKMKLRPLQGKQRYILNDHLTVDDQAFDNTPDDIPSPRDIFPVEVKSDGDCLPSCGSVFAFGSPNFSTEMRVRIVHELVLHEDVYLSKEHLTQGAVPSSTTNNLPKTFAMYSDVYVPGMALTESFVKQIFEKEVLSICKAKSFMGIWQLFSLSSVLALPIYSVYPKLGNPNVRADLNRMIYPRQTSVSRDCIYILWTSTRYDMLDKNWMPNHFVPVLPIDSIDHDAASDIEEGNERTGTNEMEQGGKAEQVQIGKMEAKRQGGVVDRDQEGQGEAVEREVMGQEGQGRAVEMDREGQEGAMERGVMDQEGQGRAMEMDQEGQGEAVEREVMGQEGQRGAVEMEQEGQGGAVERGMMDQEGQGRAMEMDQEGQGGAVDRGMMDQEGQGRAMEMDQEGQEGAMESGVMDQEGAVEMDREGQEGAVEMDQEGHGVEMDQKVQGGAVERGGWTRKAREGRWIEG